ncbi:hypothetical protein CKW39_05240 [Kocuria sp. WRN011]|uniref:MmyB family transcriptional regulator n=1 Tax=Kocuria sp. WRN011 TaxID=2029858 RepID=UPI000BB0A7DD|nr:hypothetical protein [Kocuria sp. WRN011]PBB08973.1 hypothetical protein CKW39_05240 [Kocuria sp. WRN011]
MFADPHMRELDEDSPLVARTCVGILRREVTQNPHEPEPAALVGRLSIADDNVHRWWSQH